MDRLDRIRIFQMVAEVSSFAEAARKLRIAPVAASRAVAALEKELEVTLLRRTTRSVSLTRQGADYLARSRRALAELDDAARAIHGEDAHPRGQLVVTAPVLFGRMYVMPIVAGLLSNHPELSLRVILSDRVMRLAEEGIDVAVRIARLPDSALRATRLATVRQVWVASPSYLAKRGVPAALEDLGSPGVVRITQGRPPTEKQFRARYPERCRLPGVLRDGQGSCPRRKFLRQSPVRGCTGLSDCDYRRCS
jgi:DNA-binding transcriptional LysR family regulator